MQANSFSRCDPHPSCLQATKATKLFALRTDLRQRTPAVDSRYPHDLRFKPRMYERKKSKEAERRQTRIQPPHLSGAARAERCALASRRSTTALCQWDYSSQGSTWARLRDTKAKRGRSSRQPLWHFQRCTSRAGPSAGRLMPRPPGSGSDEPPRAGTASRSAMQGHRITSLYASEIETPFSNLKHEVKAFRFLLLDRDVTRRVRSRPMTRFERRFADSEVVPVNQGLLGF